MSRPELDRRTFVAATGAVGVLALAGCVDEEPGEDEEANPGVDTGTDENGDES
ncbi:hypothetical protein [Natrarchaeobaculum aegyptiacum]|uniref:hypothetical protein n=1 Tax=Natrarchaeobaculum aegyptiacum TaxID=745377 RepID=UPI00137475EF|nr:hypothetical protein [Natrarchaeobaculum aegyptiacum]